LAAPSFQKRLSIKTVVIGANWVWALAMPWVGISHNLVIVAALLGLMAFVGPMLNVAIDVYRLLITPDHLQGRVYSATSLLAYGAIPFGSLLAAFLLSFFGSEAATIVISGLMLAVALAATLAPAIRRAPKARGYEQAMAGSASR
jgi:hypothetical protein